MTSVESATAAANAANPATSSIISSDFETFIRMLTVQAENQDPLNPMDSSEYAMQLATFSSVEQQVLSNSLLNNLLAATGQSNLAQLAQWVGMEGQTYHPVPYDGAAIEVVGTALPTADFGDLVVYDETETEVARIRMTPDAEQTTWDGTFADGSEAPNASYRFEIESTISDTVVQVAPGAVWMGITEAHRDPLGGVILTFENGGALASDSIAGVRMPR